VKPLLKLAILVAAINTVVANVSAQAVVSTSTGSNVNQVDAQRSLDFHNAKRKDVGSPPLQWSTDLAAVAQKWADHLAANGCSLQHTQGGLYGENLFGGGGKPYTAVDASQDWYSEISKFHDGPLTPSNWAPAGHYTQMVWSKTAKVGMGRATCSGGLVVIVAEYDPPGNYMGQKPY
jgi:pathogenesis-related protein 1